MVKKKRKHHWKKRRPAAKIYAGCAVAPLSPTIADHPSRGRKHGYDYSDPLNYTDGYLYDRPYYYGGTCASCVHWDGHGCRADRGSCAYESR